MKKIPKSMVDKAIIQIAEIHEKVSKIVSNQYDTVWLDVAETCRYLKVSSRTLQNYRDKGLLPFSQINSKIYFRKHDLESFLEKHLVNPSKF